MMVQFDVKRVSKGSESFMVSFDFAKTPITQVADYIIIAASKKGTSDIHFDPREDGLMVRFRIDGDLQDYTLVPKSYEKNLATRLKLLANMNITETRLPQDGAIKGQFGDEYLDMRVSCLPVSEGEKIVIRILDYTRSLQGIDSLGFNEVNLKKLKRMMGVPNGIILTTGATGSGKSTTTYSILQGLNTPETNIITVEDPIEMNIEGINQVQVNAEIGMTFAAALRSILRQDPNVILIGEIRDSETAQIAVRASITGHLVLSTIHTNNSLATIERLLDMDVERYLLSTALTGIISQRLAKQLCEHCRCQRETTQYEKKVFRRFMKKKVNVVWTANPEGCEHCRKGYHGRIAIQEVLELDDEIRAAISNEKLEKEDLAKMVYTDKTITMLQDALGKVLDGLTSFEEVYRVIEIESEDSNHYTDDIAEEDLEVYEIPADQNNNSTEKATQPPTEPKTESQTEAPVEIKSEPTTEIPTEVQTEVPTEVQTEAPQTMIPQIDESQVETTEPTPSAPDSLLDVLQSVSLDEQVQLPNIIDTPGNKTIENTTQTDTFEMPEDGQMSILELISKNATTTETPPTEPKEVESLDTIFSQLQTLSGTTATPTTEQQQEQQTEPANDTVIEIPIVTQSVEQSTPEQTPETTEEVTKEPEQEQVSTEVENPEDIQIQPTEVLTLEKLDTDYEEDTNLITLSTDVQIQGPAELNAEPLVPQFNLDD